MARVSDDRVLASGEASPRLATVLARCKSVERGYTLHVLMGFGETRNVHMVTICSGLDSFLAVDGSALGWVYDDSVVLLFNR